MPTIEGFLLTNELQSGDEIVWDFFPNGTPNNKRRVNEIEEIDDDLFSISWAGFEGTEHVQGDLAWMPSDLVVAPAPLAAYAA